MSQARATSAGGACRSSRRPSRRRAGARAPPGCARRRAARSRGGPRRCSRAGRAPRSSWPSARAGRCGACSTAAPRARDRRSSASMSSSWPRWGGSALPSCVSPGRRARWGTRRRRHRAWRRNLLQSHCCRCACAAASWPRTSRGRGRCHVPHGVDRDRQQRVPESGRHRITRPRLGVDVDVGADPALSVRVGESARATPSASQIAVSPTQSDGHASPGEQRASSFLRSRRHAKGGRRGTPRRRAIRAASRARTARARSGRGPRTRASSPSTSGTTGSACRRRAGGHGRASAARCACGPTRIRWRRRSSRARCR